MQPLGRGRYRAFMKKNPDFTGKVHILCHSLGSVITFDVLSSPELRDQLKFTDRLTNCWAIGSPLATFLLLRLPDFEANSSPYPFPVPRIRRPMGVVW